MSIKANQSGLSLLEVLLAMAIASVLATVFLTVSLNYVATIMTNKASAELAIESNFALQNMVEDIRLADGVAATNTITDANAPVGGWVTSEASNVLILNSPATTVDNDVIYDPSTGLPYRNQTIYFISGGKLYKRILKNTDAAGNRAVTTCPAAAMTSTCPSDRQYSSFMQDINFSYFDTDNVVTADPASARSVRLTAILSRKAYGKTITSSNTIQATQRNF